MDYMPLLKANLRQSKSSTNGVCPSKEKKEAERKRIEAEGERDAQNILREGITEGNIKWKSLEVLKEISTSPNAKLIITDGSSPVLINGDE